MGDAQGLGGSALPQCPAGSQAGLHAPAHIAGLGHGAGAAAMHEPQRCTGCSQVHGARREKKGTRCTGAISLLRVHCSSRELTPAASCSPPAPGPYASISRHFIPFIFSSLQLHGAWPHLSFVLDVLGFHPGLPSVQPQFC